MVNLLYYANYGLDFFSFILSFLISYYSFKIYKLTKNREENLLSISFFFIGLSLLVKLFSNYFTNFYKFGFDKINISFEGTIIFNSLLIIGYSSLYLLVFNIRKRKIIPIQLLLLAYTILLSTMLNIYYFQITHIILLIYPVLFFYKKYGEKNRTQNLLVFLSFSLLLLSHFVQLPLNLPIFFDNVLRLFSFSLLSLVFLGVFKK